MSKLQTPTRNKQKRRAPVGQLSHMASPRKKIMHNKRSPSLDEIASSARSPFPPSPGERRFGTDRTRFLQAVAAERAHRAAVDVTLSMDNGDGGGSEKPLDGKVRLSNVASTAFRPCGKTQSPMKNANVSHLDNDSSSTVSDSSDEGVQSGRDLKVGKMRERSNAKASSENFPNRGRDGETESSSNDCDSSDTQSEDTESSDGSDSDGEVSSNGEINTRSSFATRTKSKNSNSKCQSFGNQKSRASNNRVSTGEPKCLAALFDATNISVTLQEGRVSKGKKQSTALNDSVKEPDMQSAQQSKQQRGHVQGAANMLCSRHSSSEILLPLPPRGLLRKVEKASSGVRWTEFYDKLLSAAVLSLPYCRWDLVRTHSGDDISEGSEQCRESIKETEENAMRDHKEFESSTAPTNSLGEEEPKGAGYITRRIGSPHTQPSMPNVELCDLGTKTPEKNSGKRFERKQDSKPSPLEIFTEEDLEQRWRVICPSIKGPWRHGEDALLRAGVETFGEENWAHIAKHIPGRRGKQCRERWRNHLDPNLNKSKWTPEEDTALLAAQKRLGNKWSEISKLLSCGRGENAVKNRFHSLRLSKMRKNKRKTIDSTQICGPPSPSLSVHGNKRKERNRPRSSSAHHLTSSINSIFRAKSGRLLSKGTGSLRRRHTFSGARQRSMSLGRLMSRSRRPSNAHIRSMTRAFLGVEISRIQEKTKACTQERQAPLRQIQHSQSRKSAASPGGNLAALKAAADIAEAAQMASTQKKSVSTTGNETIKQNFEAGSNATRGNCLAHLGSSRDALAIRFATSCFLDREQQQRAGVAGFCSTSPDTCIKLVQLVHQKNQDIANLRAQINVMSKSSSCVSEPAAKSRSATNSQFVDPSDENTMVDMAWNNESDDAIARMPSRDNANAKEAAESLLALSGYGSKD